MGFEFSQVFAWSPSTSVKAQIFKTDDSDAGELVLTIESGTGAGGSITVLRERDSGEGLVRFQALVAMLEEALRGVEGQQ